MISCMSIVNNNLQEKAKASIGLMHEKKQMVGFKEIRLEYDEVIRILKTGRIP